MSHLDKALEPYEALERLKYDDDFNVFKGMVDKKLLDLDTKIHNATDESVLVDIQVHKLLTQMFEGWLNNAEEQAKSMRTTLKQREEGK